MSGKEEIAIKDACILFDLVDLNLLEFFFQLEVSAFTTPQVIGEITNETQWGEISKFINSGKLRIDADGEFEVIARIFNEHAGLSLPDSSVLELAIRKDAVIFSSDGSLRKISVAQNLKIRGVLWIVEELFNKSLLSKKTSIEKLNFYGIINQRAPVNEIKKMVAKISKYDT